MVGTGGNHTLSAVDLSYTIQLSSKGSKVTSLYWEAGATEEVVFAKLGRLQCFATSALLRVGCIMPVAGFDCSSIQSSREAMFTRGRNLFVASPIRCLVEIARY